jgi:prefoldin subunit 5
MIQIPDNFPSYTSYSPKTLIMQVDTLKAALRELQQEIAALKAVPATVKTKTEKTDKV